MTWRESPDGVTGSDPGADIVERLTGLHRGRIQSAYVLETAVDRTGGDQARAH